MILERSRTASLMVNYSVECFQESMVLQIAVTMNHLGHIRFLEIICKDEDISLFQKMILEPLVSPDPLLEVLKLKSRLRDIVDELEDTSHLAVADYALKDSSRLRELELYSICVGWASSILRRANLTSLELCNINRPTMSQIIGTLGSYAPASHLEISGLSASC